ncbi:MAG: SDR family oxidoreductase [Nannocystaceae bacterium]
MKTALITGCSSGYGLETARYFHDQGWSVLATMRTPRPELLPASDRMRVVAIDVTRPEQIAAVMRECQVVDALVNNAGIGAFGAFEVTPMDFVRELFEVNTLGPMRMMQAVIPQLRARGEGVIVNVTSSVTLAPMPMVASYTASKTALEGFSGSLALELRRFGVRVKLVEPGYCPNTRLGANARVSPEQLIPEAYAPYAQEIFASLAEQTATTRPSDVAEAVWRAAHDTSDQLRFPAGADAVLLAGAAH